MGEWRNAESLDDVADMLSGGTPSKSNHAYWDGPIPWLTPKDMSDWSGQTEATISRSAIGNGTRLAPVNSIFIAVRGMSLHNEIRIVIPKKSITFNQDIKAIVPKPNIDPQYLYYILLWQKPRLLSDVEAAGHGTGRLPTDKLKAIQVPRFDPPTETAIATLFSTIDDKIDLNRRTNATLEAMALTLYKDWFVDFGPTRAKMDGREPYLAPDLWALFPDSIDEGTSVPSNWPMEPLYDQADWVNGAAYSKMHFSDAIDALPVVKIAELKAGITESTKRTNTALGQRYKIEKGELLFSWSGNPDTSIDAFIWTEGAAWLNQHIFAVRENGKHSKAALFFLLKHHMPEFAEIARNKQTTGLGHVTKADMQRMKVCTGSEAIRKTFDDIGGQTFEQIVGNLSENQILARTRDLLLPKLMSGEIRLRDAERAAGETL